MNAITFTRSNQNLWQSLDAFFYRREVPYGLALVRIVLPLVLLCVVIPRWIYARELYSADGAAAPLAVNYGYADFLPEPSGTVAVGLMTLLAVTLITSSLGWWSRPSLVISMGLYTYLNLLDCLSSMTKYTVIASHILLLLSFSPCGTVWSIDSLRSRRKKGLTQPIEHVAYPVWSRRLIQLLIGLVYFGAATTKLHTDAYFTGDQLRWWMMTNVNRINPVGEWLSSYLWVLIVMAHAAIVWQMLFVFLCWRGIGRIAVLGFGVTFHSACGPLLGLYLFPAVMITSYCAFLDERDVLRIGHWLRRHTTASPVRLLAILRQRVACGVRGRDWATGGVAYAAVLIVAAATGVAAEHVLDPYGIRRTEGPHQLVIADQGLVRRMSSEPEPIHEADKFLTFDVGTQMLGGVLLDSRTEVAPGEPFLVQASLTMLHDDLWLECNLHDAADRLIHRAGQIAPRERLRVEWHYTLPNEFERGEYFLVLVSSGEEIGRRRIVLQ